MDTQKYVTLVHHCLAISMSLIVSYCSSRILLQRTKCGKRFDTIVPALLVYFSYVFIASLISLTYLIYIFSFWRFETNIYNATIIYYLGGIQWVWLNISSFNEFFLCIDRCLTVIFPIKYGTTLKKYFAFIYIGGIILGLFIVIHVNNIFVEIPEGSTNCRFFSCLIVVSSPYKMYLRVTWAALNLSGGTMLAILLRINLSVQNCHTKRMNKTVLYMIFTTTLIELIPFLGAQIFIFIWHFDPLQLLGPYGNNLILINITLSSFTYSKAITRAYANKVYTNAVIVTSIPRPSK